MLFSFLQNAVMTFEEEKMSLALSTLRTAEKRCTSDISWSPSFNNLQQTVRSRLWRLPSREVVNFRIFGRQRPENYFSFASVGLTEYQLARAWIITGHFTVANACHNPGVMEKVCQNCKIHFVMIFRTFKARSFDFDFCLVYVGKPFKLKSS